MAYSYEEWKKRQKNRTKPSVSAPIFSEFKANYERNNPPAERPKTERWQSLYEFRYNQQAPKSEKARDADADRFAARYSPRNSDGSLKSTSPKDLANEHDAQAPKSQKAKDADADRFAGRYTSEQNQIQNQKQNADADRFAGRYSAEATNPEKYKRPAPVTPKKPVKVRTTHRSGSHSQFTNYVDIPDVQSKKENKSSILSRVFENAKSQLDKPDFHERQLEMEHGGESDMIKGFFDSDNVNDTYSEKSGAGLRLGIGNTVESVSSTMRWLQSKTIPFGDKVPNLGAAAVQKVADGIKHGFEDEQQEFELEDWNDLDYLSSAVPQALPQLILSLAPALAVAGLTGKISKVQKLPKLLRTIVENGAGAGAQATIDSSLEAGGVFDEAIRRGHSEDEARMMANDAFNKNFLLNSGTSFTEMLLIRSKLGKGFGGLNKGTQVGLRTAGGAVTEGLQEGTQELISASALGDDFSWTDPSTVEAMLLGGILGGGVTASVTGFKEVKDAMTKAPTINSPTPEIIESSIDELPPEIRQEFDEAVAELEGRDIPREEALEIVAEQLIDRTPAFGDIIAAKTKEYIANKKLEQQSVDTNPVLKEQQLQEELAQAQPPLEGEPPSLLNTETPLPTPLDTSLNVPSVAPVEQSFENPLNTPPVQEVPTQASEDVLPLLDQWKMQQAQTNPEPSPSSIDVQVGDTVNLQGTKPDTGYVVEAVDGEQVQVLTPNQKSIKVPKSRIANLLHREAQEAELEQQSEQQIPLEPMALEQQMPQEVTTSEQQMPTTLPQQEKSFDGVTLARRNKTGKSTNPEDRPQGLYTSMVKDKETFVSPFEDEGDVTLFGKLKAKNPLVLEELVAEHARFGGRKSGNVSSGISALHQLVGETEFKKLMKLSKPEVKTLLEEQFPGPDYGRYHDAYELLEVYAAQLARTQGYDAFILEDKTDPDFSEVAVLSNSAIEYENESKQEKPKQQDTSEQVAKDFNSKTWYHGSRSENLSKDKIDPFATDITSLFGLGFYMTEDIEIAKNYADGRKSRSGEPTIYEIKTSAKRVLDLETIATKEIIDAIVKPFNNELGDDYKKSIKETEPLEKIFQDLREDLSNSQTPTSELAESFGTVLTNLLKLGYDGYTHTGGKRTGYPEHRVFILFDPNNVIKSKETDYAAIKSFKKLADISKVENKKKVEAKQEEQKAEPKGDYTITKDKHTKTGADIWIVQQQGPRLEKEAYVELAKQMKSLGGYYSKFKKGFIFKKDPTDKLNGKVSTEVVEKSEKVVEQSGHRSPTRIAERLRGTAKGMQKTIDSKRNDNRLTNTHKRATEDAHARNEADKLERLQGIMNRIADAIESGEATFLNNVTAKTHIEVLDRIVSSIKRGRSTEQLTPSQREKIEKQPITDAEINDLTLPKVNLYWENVQRLLEAMAGTKGMKRSIDRIMKEVKAAKAANNHLIDGGPIREEMLKIAELAIKTNNKEKYHAESIKERYGDLKRLESMKLDTTESLRSGIHEYLKYAENIRENTEQKLKNEKRKKEAELSKLNITGFFPTPSKVIDRMIEESDIESGMKVLEPSAGKGNIAERIRKEHKDVTLDVVEYNNTLHDYLKSQDFNVVGEDFLQFEGKYDRIIMNPPFEKGQDIDHVQHAYNLLEPGGRVVAIMSEGPFFRGDKKATGFREWLEENGGVSDKLEGGSFKDSERSTGVATRMVTIDKPFENNRDTLIIERVNKEPFVVKRDDEVLEYSMHDKTFKKVKVTSISQAKKQINGTDYGFFYPLDHNVPEEVAEKPKKNTNEVDYDLIKKYAKDEDFLKMLDEEEKKDKLDANKKGTAFTENGTKIEFEYRVVEASDLIVSNDSNGKVNPNYPQELQPRDRSRKASQVQVQNIAQKLNPVLVGESSKASDGAPIVGPDMVVESGNGRTMAIQKMYEELYSPWQAYNEFLSKNADKFGLDKTAIHEMEHPILVRVRTNEVDRKQFVSEANEASVSAMSAAEQAAVDAGKMNNKLISLFMPAENGELNTSSNRAFITAFMGDVVAKSERGRYMTSEGALSQEGLSRVRNAVFAKAYGNNEAINILAESTDNNVRNVINAMLKSAPRFAIMKEKIANETLYNEDITNDIVAAMVKLAELRKEGTSVQSFLDQPTLFDDGLSVETKEMLLIFEDKTFKRSAKALSELFGQYVNVLEVAGSPNQILLFENTPPNKTEILATALKRVKVDENSEVQTNLFETESQSDVEIGTTPKQNREKQGETIIPPKKLTANTIINGNDPVYNENISVGDTVYFDIGTKRFTGTVLEIPPANQPRSLALIDIPSGKRTAMRNKLVKLDETEKPKSEPKPKPQPKAKPEPKPKPKPKKSYEEDDVYVYIGDYQLKHPRNFTMDELAQIDHESYENQSFIDDRKVYNKYIGLLDKEYERRWKEEEKASSKSSKNEEGFSRSKKDPGPPTDGTETVDSTQTDKTVTRSQIIDFVQTHFDTTVGVGKTSGRLGFYKNKFAIMRTKDYGDFEVIAHELGHRIDKRLGLSLNPKIRDEFIRLAEWNLEIPEAMSKETRAKEGVAEYFRQVFYDQGLSNKAMKIKDLSPELRKAVSDGLTKQKWNKPTTELKKLTESWMNRDGEQELGGIYSPIGEKRKNKRTVKSIMNEVYTRFYDKDHPIWVAMRLIEKETGQKIDGNLDAYARAVLTRGSVARAATFVKGRTFDEHGRITGESFEAILEEVDNVENFDKYLIAKHALHLKTEKGKHKTPITPEKIEEYLASAKPEYEALAKRVYAYQQRALQVLVDGGLIDPKLPAKLKEKYPYYVPFYRVQTEDGMRDGPSGGGVREGQYVNNENGLKGMKEHGSTKNIISPIESIIKNTHLYFALADHNSVGRALAEFANPNNPLAAEITRNIIEAVEPDLRVTEIALEQIEKTLLNAGLEQEMTEELDMKAIAKIFEPIFRPNVSKNEVMVWIEGKPKMFKIRDPLLYDALVAQDSRAINDIARWVLKPAELANKALRQGITMSPFFTVITFARSAMQLGIKTEATWGNYFTQPFRVIKAMKSVVKRDDALYDWWASGGAQSTFIATENDYLTKELEHIALNRKTKDMLKGQNMSMKDKRELAFYMSKKGLGTPFKMLNVFNDVLDQSIKLAEYQVVMKQTGGDRVKAALASREADLDYKRFGSTGMQFANKYWLFWNVAFQGPDNLFRYAAKNKVRFGVRGGLLVTLPTLILYAMNRDDEEYQELTTFEKDMYWNIPKGDGKFWKIKIPFEAGILFKTIPEKLLGEAMDYAKGENKQSWKDFRKNTTETMLVNFLPTLLDTAAEYMAERDLETGREIVPMGVQSNNKPDEYDERTSEIFKAVGKFLNRSPILLEHAYKSLTGQVGQFFLYSTDVALDKLGIVDRPDIKGLTNTTFVERQYTTSVNDGSTNAINTFYPEYARLKQDHEDNGVSGRPSPLLKAFGRANDDMIALRKVKKGMFSNDLVQPDGSPFPYDEKKRRIVIIDNALRDIARDVQGLEPLDPKGLEEAWKMAEGYKDYVKYNNKVERDKYDEENQ